MSPARSSHVYRHSPHFIRRDLHRIEPLEPRQLLSGGSVDSALDLFVAPAVHGAPTITNPTPIGLSPSAVSQAYGFGQLALTGAGETIAIVDAYGDSKLTGDLQSFDQAFGLPSPALTVVNQNGGTRLPSNNSGWALETSLDVEWAHAMAPGAKLLLVEAGSNSLGNLLTAVNVARNYPGVTAVSMSWGAGEFAGETAYDHYFTTPTNRPGITFVAASGDSGGQVTWPAASPNVLSTGGTTLTLTSSGNYSSESGWGGSGGGLSAYESRPAYQSAGGLAAGAARAVPDVAYNADPNSGVAVYDSLSYSGHSGWFQVGGTSAAAPQWAALVADANQGRQAAGQAPLANAQATLYSLASTPAGYAANFHDVTSGTAGANSAGSGFDLVTGLGTPIANNLVASLVSASTTASASFAGSTANNIATGSASSSDTTSNTPDPRELIEIIFFTPPHLIDGGPAVTPIIITPSINHPAPAASVALPADTPVHLAINSLLVDDPLDVPLKPAKRRAGDAAPQSDETPEPGQQPSDSAAFGLWDADPFSDVAWVDELVAARFGPTATAAQIADACFAEGDVLGTANEPSEMAISAAGMIDGRANQFLGIAGMFLAAVVVDRGRVRTGGNALESETRQLRRRAPSTRCSRSPAD